MSKKLNEGGAAGADPTQSPEAAAAEAERVRAEQEAAEKAEAERVAAEKAADEAAQAAAEAGLVKMGKGDESIDVHPTCVNAHLSAGWKVSQ